MSSGSVGRDDAKNRPVPTSNRAKIIERLAARRVAPQEIERKPGSIIGLPPVLISPTGSGRIAHSKLAILTRAETFADAGTCRGR